jgi:hypothetical protein
MTVPMSEMKRCADCDKATEDGRTCLDCQHRDLCNEFSDRFYERDEPFTEDAARAEFLLNYPGDGLDSGGDPGHHQTLREVVEEVRRILGGEGATWSREELSVDGDLPPWTETADWNR